MIVKNDIYLRDFNAWSGGRETLDRLIEAGVDEDFQHYIESLYPDGIDATQLNDWLWFDKDNIFAMYGIGEGVESSRKAVKSRFSYGDETSIEIERNGKWRIVGESNDERGWSLNPPAKVFDTEKAARASDLVKRLAKSGYTESNGNLRFANM